MHTKDILADALRAAGLSDIAARAAAGHYHDYLSELDMPVATLVGELTELIQRNPTQGLIDLRQQVMSGKFDASKEEADAWYAAQDEKNKAIFEEAVRKQKELEEERKAEGIRSIRVINPGEFET